MNGALIAARLVLALTFLLAGVAKLSDLRGSRRAAADLGVPPLLAGPTGTLLPIVELACGAAMVPGSSARWGATGALVLLAAFIVAIVTNLWLGRRPDCHCFGQLHSSPIGWKTFLRNTMLAGMAVFVVAGGPGPPPFDWVSRLSTAGTIALGCGLTFAVLTALQSWFSLTLFRRYGKVLVRVDELEAALQRQGVPVAPPGPAPEPARLGLPIGAPAPPFSLPNPDGEQVGLGSLVRRGLPVVLVFSDPECRPCKALMPDVARWQQDHADDLTFAVLTRVQGRKRRPAVVEGVSSVLSQDQHEVAEAYQALATPSAVVVRPDRRIGSRVTTGSEAIGQLIEETLAPVPEPAAGDGDGRDGPPSLGRLAPRFALKDLRNRQVTLETYRGREVVLLFWSTSCGFCNQILPHIKMWEADPPEDAPALLLISNGSVEDNRRMGLTSRVVIDPDFSVGQAFGTMGTPSAVVVDAHGAVASEVAVGTGDVLLMLGYREPEAVQA